MSRSLKSSGSQGNRSAALVRRAPIGVLSIALSTAAIEFVLCGTILLILTALGVLAAETAMVWGAVVLVPLAVTIGFLGIRLGILSRRTTSPGRGLVGGEARLVT